MDQWWFFTSSRPQPGERCQVRGVVHRGGDPGILQRDAHGRSDGHLPVASSRCQTPGENTAKNVAMMVIIVVNSG
jgi:hypothetical protein